MSQKTLCDDKIKKKANQKINTKRPYSQPTASIRGVSITQFGFRFRLNLWFTTFCQELHSLNKFLAVLSWAIKSAVSIQLKSNSVREH